MGSTKELWIDRIKARQNSRLANILGITYDELDQIHYEIDDNTSSDGLLYGYIVTFDEDNDPSIMSKVKGLESGSYVTLSPWDLEDPEENETEWEVVNSEQLETLNKHLSSVPVLLDVEIDEDARFSQLVMLHAHIISALEQFLSSTFIHNVTKSDMLTRKLIKKDPEFGSRKFTVNEIYAQHRDIKSTVATYLKTIIFHDMRKVKPMYADILGCELGDISWLFRAVLRRHDCAHRAGFDKAGKPIEVSAEGIRELLGKCRQLASAIDDHVRETNYQ